MSNKELEILLQEALQHVDNIVDRELIEISDERARRTGNYFGKRKFNVRDAKQEAKHAAALLRKMWEILDPRTPIPKWSVDENNQ